MLAICCCLEYDIPTRHVGRSVVQFAYFWAFLNTEIRVGFVIVGRATVTPRQKNVKAGIQVSSWGSVDKG